jgi:hypothetical protein
MTSCPTTAMTRSLQGTQELALLKVFAKYPGVRPAQDLHKVPREWPHSGTSQGTHDPALLLKVPRRWPRSEAYQGTQGLARLRVFTRSSPMPTGVTLTASGHEWSRVTLLNSSNPHRQKSNEHSRAGPFTCRALSCDLSGHCARTR